ncbi:MAG: thiamine pyrophosphate-binding protein, partial [bacterium]
MLKLSDYVLSFIAELNIKHLFFIVGGGNMHLADSLGRNKDIEHVCTLHEQAAAMAAEGYARVTNNLGAALVTSGPGGTNTITGLCGAWIDSTPCIFISGQVNLQDTILNKPLRQVGIQEINITDIVKPITKYAVMITDPNTIKYHLQKAVYLAKTGRPGPVWIDIPLNFQAALIDEHKLPSFKPPELKINLDSLKQKVSESIDLIKQASQPVILAGNGIRLAGAQKEFMQLVEKLKFPVLTTWGAADLIPEDFDLYIGRPGMIGQRGANFAIQNSDLLLSIGSRLSIPQTGYNFKAFAREAKKIIVDIDNAELEKGKIRVDIPINFGAKEFIKEMNGQLSSYSPNNINGWIDRCKEWKSRYPVVLPEYFNQKSPVSSYVFIDALSDELDNNDVIVTDMGTSFTCTFQTFKVKRGQRFFTSSGLAAMGFGLPGSIGACFGNNKKRTICISGEGGLQMNIQELQTLVTHDLPIKLFVLNNQGYLTIKHTQNTHFKGHYVGSGRTSKLIFPDIIKVAHAYGLKTEKITSHDELKDKINSVLKTPGPVVC